MLPLALGPPVMVAGGLTEAVDKVGMPLFVLGAVAAIVGVAAGASRVVLGSARLAGRWARTPETLLAARS